MTRRYKTALCVSALALIGVLAETGPAAAQRALYEQYAFPQTNRASMAVVIKQAESGMFTSSSGVADSSGSAAAPVFLCGGSSGGSSTSSSSSATANSSCIILNNSNGNISIDQDSKGSQTSKSGVDEINQALQNNPATQP